jgi:hypothetical protein
MSTNSEALNHVVFSSLLLLYPPLGPNILLSAPFSSPFNVRSSFNVPDHAKYTQIHSFAYFNL